MELVIPDGVQVHITVGHPPLLALPHDPPAVASPPGLPRGRIAKGLIAGVFLVGAFQAGRLSPHRAETAAAAQPPAAVATTDGSAAAEIPPAFRALLGEPPHVVPAPGAAPTAPTGGVKSDAGPAAAPAPTNPFGLRG